MMGAFELEVLRAELARKALASDDENLLRAALDLFCNKEQGIDSYGKIPGLTYNHEERINELKESVSEYKSGKSKGLTPEELDEEMESW